MTNLIVEISKYLMILLMAVYTYANFRFFSFPDMERKGMGHNLNMRAAAMRYAKEHHKDYKDCTLIVVQSL